MVRRATQLYEKVPVMHHEICTKYLIQLKKILNVELFFPYVSVKVEFFSARTAHVKGLVEKHMCFLSSLSLRWVEKCPESLTEVKSLTLKSSGPAVGADVESEASRSELRH